MVFSWGKPVSGKTGFKRGLLKNKEKVEDLKNLKGIIIVRKLNENLNEGVQNQETLLVLDTFNVLYIVKDYYFVAPNVSVLIKEEAQDVPNNYYLGFKDGEEKI